MERHRILGDQVALYRRYEDGPWHCYTFLKGKEWRKSTKEKSLARAKDVATDWFNELQARDHLGELPTGKSFAHVAKMFTEEYEATTRGHRSPKWVQGHKDRLRLHLLPFFGKMSINEITAGTSQQYRAYRLTEPEGYNEEEVGKPWQPPARKTIHNEIVTLSLTLKTAQRHGYIVQVPDLSDPYSLRHSYICFRLLEGADIYQIAKNCRTSVEMIEKHYAAHLKDMIDTSLINVRKSRQTPKVLGAEED